MTLASWRPLAVALALCLLFASPALAAPPTPSDAHSFELTTNERSELEVTALLELVADEFGALLVVKEQIARVRIRFSNRTKVPITWGALKDLLRFYGVQVLLQQASPPEGPWTIKAMPLEQLRTVAPERFVGSKDLPASEELVTAVFQLTNGAGPTIFSNLRQLIARDRSGAGNVLYIQGPELLIVTSTTNRLRYYRRLIEALDVAGPRQQLEIFQVEHAPVTELAAVLTTVLSTLTSTGGPRQAGASSQRPVQVIPEPRTNQLIVAAFPIDFPVLRRVLNSLDKRVDGPAGRFHVYACKASSAKALAERVQGLFETPAAGPARPASPASLAPLQTKVVADEQTNSLLIQAEPAVYEQILAVLERLDRRRRSVLIEGEVWEITTPSDQLTFGFELTGLTNANEGSTRPAGLTNYGLSNVSPVTNEQGEVTRLGRTPNVSTGLTAVLTRGAFDKLPVIMNALHNTSSANLITRPFALTNDNMSATFAITDSVPFLTSNVTPVGATTGVDYAKASTSLEIKPQINADDNLTLELNLDLASFTARPSANLPPPINSRAYKGTVTIPNGQYMVFGGFESETDSYTENKVPFLGDIPILGHLFKSWSRDKSKSKIYVFIRATIFSSEGFGGQTRLADALREKAHVESERSDWLPPVSPVRLQKGAGYTLQDEAFEVFGLGTARPSGLRAAVSSS